MAHGSRLAARCGGSRGPVSDPAWAEAHAANTVHQVYLADRRLYGVRKLWHAMRPGHDVGMDAGRFVYTAFCVDVFSRRILGWRVMSTKATPLVSSVLEQAVFTRGRTDFHFTTTGSVHHVRCRQPVHVVGGHRYDTAEPAQ